MRSGENSSASVRQDTTRGPTYAPAGTCARCATRMRPSWTRTTRPVRRCSASCTALRRSLVGVRGVPDAPAPQVIAAGPVAVGLVRGEAVGLLAGTAQSGAGNADFLQHGLELGAVRLLPWRDDQGQRATAAVRAQVELAGEPSARAAQALTSSTTSTRRAARLCQGVSSWCSVTSAPLRPVPAGVRCGHRQHVGEHGRWWSRPRCPSRSHPPRPPRPGPAEEDAPTFRLRTTAGGVRRRSSMGRTVRAGHATERRSVRGAESRRSPGDDPATGHNACC